MVSDPRRRRACRRGHRFPVRADRRGGRASSHRSAVRRRPFWPGNISALTAATLFTGILDRLLQASLSRLVFIVRPPLPPSAARTGPLDAASAGARSRAARCQARGPRPRPRGHLDSGEDASEQFCMVGAASASLGRGGSTSTAHATISVASTGPAHGVEMIGTWVGRAGRGRRRARASHAGAKRADIETSVDARIGVDRGPSCSAR